LKNVLNAKEKEKYRALLNMVMMIIHILVQYALGINKFELLALIVKEPERMKVSRPLTEM
jgi:hypothetical protein